MLVADPRILSPDEQITFCSSVDEMMNDMSIKCIILNQVIYSRQRRLAASDTCNSTNLLYFLHVFFEISSDSSEVSMLISDVLNSDEFKDSVVSAMDREVCLQSAEIVSTPTSQPSFLPSKTPSIKLSSTPSVTSSSQPSSTPSEPPSSEPSGSPSTDFPSQTPSISPSRKLSSTPSVSSSSQPSSTPSESPSSEPSGSPSTDFPSQAPSISPSRLPSQGPTTSSFVSPSAIPMSPSSSPSQGPVSEIDVLTPIVGTFV
jgi:hypothetical protein